MAFRSRQAARTFVRAATLSLLLTAIAVPAAHADGEPAAMHSCVVKSNGTVQCWGSNEFGQLGNGESGGISTSPVQVTGLTDAKLVATGASSSCAVRETGAVVCWGDNRLGQLGSAAAGAMEAVSTPVAVDDVDDATAVAAGMAQACAIRASGKLRCWGWGQPPNELDAPGAVSVTVGVQHACVVFGDGHIECAGDNSMGQIGDGTTEARYSLVPVPGITNAREVVAGYGHTCARLADKTVKCWGGLNDLGILGDGTGASSLVPVSVAGVDDAVQLGSSLYQACVVRTSGDVKCWGWNFSGMPDPGDPAVISPTAEPWPGLSHVAGIVGGAFHMCAVLEDGTVPCWGYNSHGGVGNGVAGLQMTPSAAVPGITGATAVSAGQDHVCALRADATVSCWGQNDDGQLGNGTTANAFEPVSVSSLAAVAQVAAGSEHTCARKSNGTVWCWGANNQGQLGDGTTDSSSVPVEVSGISTATQVAAGEGFSCALLADSSVKCWGYGGQGQLPGWQNSSVPVTIDGLPDPEFVGAVELDAGGSTACVVTVSWMASTQLARCWGAGSYGELGDGQSQGGPSAGTVIGDVGWELEDAAGVTVGGSHACMFATAGPVCWGSGSDGQLGNGGTSNSPFATALSSGSPVAISAGGRHTCAVESGGSVSCWGEGEGGKLGSGTFAGATTPAAVSGLSGVSAVAAGGTFTCALASGGTVKCWGAATNGQMGDGIERVLQPSAEAVAGVSGAVLNLPAWPGGDEGGGDNGGGTSDEPIVPDPIPPLEELPLPTDDTPKQPETRAPVTKPAAIRLSGRSLVFAGYSIKRTAGRCPARVRVQVRVKGARKATIKSLKVVKAGEQCVLRSTLKLTGSAAGAKSVTVKLSGAKIKARIVTVRRTAAKS